MGSIRTPPNPPSSPPLTKIDDSSSVQECLMSRLVASSVPFSHLFSPVMSTFPGNWKQQPSVVSLWRLATGKYERYWNLVECEKNKQKIYKNKRQSRRENASKMCPWPTFQGNFFIFRVARTQTQRGRPKERRWGDYRRRRGYIKQERGEKREGWRSIEKNTRKCMHLCDYV